MAAAPSEQGESSSQAMRAANHGYEDDGDDEFESVSEGMTGNHGYEGDEDEEEEDEGDADTPPTHPVPALQQAFEESIIEATEDVQYETVPLSATHPSAELRRQQLLDQDTYDDSWNTRWRQKPSARCHPLTKLIAQIIFGMHLLYNYQAKSDAEVVKILQAHVDDIDGFLEKSTDDIDLAIEDIEERLDFLRLPMTHLDVFDVMLDDKVFRTQLIEGNDKIEKIIERTAKAMNAALSDIAKGIKAVEELAKYLDQVKDDWPEDYTELPAIFAAMRGNQDGWSECLEGLQMKGNKLGVALVQLGTIIREMNKAAASASRRSMVSRSSIRFKQRSTDILQVRRSTSISAPRSKYSSGSHLPKHSRQSKHMSRHSLDKPLPEEPDPLQPAIQATLPQSRQRHSMPPDVGISQQFRKSQTVHNRTNTKLEPREPQSPRTAETSIMAAFIRHSGPPTGPLDSNPPSSKTPGGTTAPTLAPAPVNDSAYSSGSDPAAERRWRKNENTPARLGLFPDSKPATPESLSRPNSTMATTPSSSIRQPSHLQKAPATQSAPLAAKHSHFSLRRIFHRKSRIQEVI